eukprot:4269864-Amphidinium_carterae.1
MFSRKLSQETIFSEWACDSPSDLNVSGFQSMVADKGANSLCSAETLCNKSWKRYTADPILQHYHHNALE